MRQAVLFAVALVAWPVSALAASETEPPVPSVPYIEVNATAHREVPYDRVTLSFEFIGEGQDAESVAKELAEKLSNFAKSVDALKIPPNQTRFSGPHVKVRFKREFDKGVEILANRRPDGFTGSADAHVDLFDFSRASAVVSAALTLGGLVQAPSYTVTTENKVDIELALEATQLAARHARDMIAAAGGKPGKIIFIGDPEGIDSGEADLPSRKTPYGVDGPAPPIFIEVPIRPGKANLGHTVRLRMEMKGGDASAGKR